MAVCVDTVKRYGLDDLRTPVFIFERLCSVIYPVSRNLELALIESGGTLSDQANTLIKIHFQSYRLGSQKNDVADVKNFKCFIFQEENDIGEFFMTLEKDPQQEDFLQGRMQGNPYSSNEPDLGPLMRDVKNKICRGGLEV